MKIDMVNDLLIPVAVGAVDIALTAWDEKRIVADPAAFRYQPLLGVVGAVAGGGMLMANTATDQAKPILHASLPLATEAVYGWIKSAMAPAGGTTTRKITRTVSPVGRRSVGYGYPNQQSMVPEFQSQQPAY